MMTKSKITRNVLTMKEQLYLANLLKDKYTASDLSNVAFTTYINANEEHRSQFRSPLTHSHIQHMLVALDIPGNTKKRVMHEDCKDMLSLTARVAGLELQISKLAKKVQAMQNDMPRGV